MLQDSLDNILHFLVQLGGIRHIGARFAAFAAEHYLAGSFREHRFDLGFDAFVRFLSQAPRPQITLRPSCPWAA